MPLQFSLAKCTGCRLCQLACSAVHEHAFNPVKARLKITHDYRGDSIKIAATRCILCKKCEEVCPVHAISNNGRWMTVNHDLCIGCGDCADACPTGVIYLDDDDKSIICDLCNGAPACVEWCPKGVISLFEGARQ